MHPPDPSTVSGASGRGGLAPVAERLRDLHHPARTRILLELAGDLEGLTAELRDRGVAESEAATRAAERVLPSDAALEALVRLHRPLYRRLTAPVPDTTLRRWERGLLLAATVMTLGAGVALLWTQGLLASPSPFLWPVLLLAGGVVAVTLAGSFRLFVRGEHGPESLGRGPALVLALSAGALLAGGAGAVAEVWWLASTLEAGGSAAAPALMPWLFQASVLVTTSLLTALAGGLAWFLLAQGMAAVRGGDEAVRRALADDRSRY
jgi:hypothetical protein